MDQSVHPYAHEANKIYRSVCYMAAAIDVVLLAAHEAFCNF